MKARTLISYIISLSLLITVVLSLCIIEGYARHYYYDGSSRSLISGIKISGARMGMRPIYQLGDSLSFTAMVDLAPSQLTHTALTQISRETGIAVIEGVVSDDDDIVSLTIYCGTDVSTNMTIEISTHTILFPAGTKYYVFQTTITVITEGAENFYYRMDVTNVNNSHALWPSDGFCKVPISNNGTQVISSSTGGTIVVEDGNPNDGQTSIEIPPGALDSDVTISITQMRTTDGTFGVSGSGVQPVSVFKFEPEGQTFNSYVTITLLYQDVDQDGYVDGTTYSETTLSVKWWDGFEWRLLGGVVDPILNVVTYNQISHFSIYAVFPAPALTNDDYRPKEKIITPAYVDAKNDFASFAALGPDDIVNIYDVTGRRIRQFKGSTTTTWDGKDDNGNMVESGLYIYQIKVDDKVISGTIVVAK